MKSRKSAYTEKEMKETNYVDSRQGGGGGGQGGFGGSTTRFYDFYENTTKKAIK